MMDTRDAAKIWIIENQFGRRNLSAYDRSVLALQLEPLYAAEAKRRQVKSGGDRKSQTYQESVSQKSDEPISQLRTDEQLAKLAGTSRDTIRKADNADLLDPADFADWDEVKPTISDNSHTP